MNSINSSEFTKKKEDNSDILNDKDSAIFTIDSIESDIKKIKNLLLKNEEENKLLLTKLNLNHKLSLELVNLVPQIGNIIRSNTNNMKSFTETSDIVSKTEKGSDKSIRTNNEFMKTGNEGIYNYNRQLQEQTHNLFSSSKSSCKEEIKTQCIAHSKNSDSSRALKFKSNSVSKMNDNKEINTKNYAKEKDTKSTMNYMNSFLNKNPITQPNQTKSQENNIQTYQKLTQMLKQILNKLIGNFNTTLDQLYYQINNQLMHPAIVNRDLLKLVTTIIEDSKKELNIISKSYYDLFPKALQVEASVIIQKNKLNLHNVKEKQDTFQTLSPSIKKDKS